MGWEAARLVEVRIARAADGTISGFQVRGHAGLAPRGADVVCAGVSALVQTAALGLQQRLGVAADITASDGEFTCRLEPDPRPGLALRAQDLLETMCLGLREIAAQSPRQVRVREQTGVGSEPAEA
jgi:uncharacterized protein YsxB (DUF464 family)